MYALFPWQFRTLAINVKPHGTIVVDDQPWYIDVKSPVDRDIEVYIGGNLVKSASLTANEWTTIVIDGTTVDGLSAGYYDTEIKDAGSGETLVKFKIRKLKTGGALMNILDENDVPLEGYKIFLDIKYGLWRVSWSTWALSQTTTPENLYYELVKRVDANNFYFLIIKAENITDGNFRTYKKQYDHIKIKFKLSEVDNALEKLLDAINPVLTTAVKFFKTVGMWGSSKVAEFFVYVVNKLNPAFPIKDFYIDGEYLIIVYRVTPNDVGIAQAVIVSAILIIVFVIGTFIAIYELWTENHRLDVVAKTQEIMNEKIDLLNKALEERKKGTISDEELEEIARALAEVYNTNANSVGGSGALEGMFIQLRDLLTLVLVLVIIKEVFSAIRKK